MCPGSPSFTIWLKHRFSLVEAVGGSDGRAVGTKKRRSGRAKRPGRSGGAVGRETSALASVKPASAAKTLTFSSLRPGRGFLDIVAKKHGKIRSPHFVNFRDPDFHRLAKGNNLARILNKTRRHLGDVNQAFPAG